jgi:phage I-like protein
MNPDKKSRFTHHALRVTAIFANEGAEVIGLFNDLVVQHDGWAMLSPYGDFPGKAILRLPNGDLEKVEAIQRVDRQAADDMVAEFKSLIGTAKRFVRGRKLFVGHPDVPGIANDYPDKSPKGVFVDLEARADGLYGKPVLTEEGSDLIENQSYKALSPYWTANEAGPENGRRIFRPNLFKSAGLTNRPQLPVKHLMNEAGKPTTTMDRTKLIALLRELGITLANEAAEDQITEALKQLGAKAATLANEKTESETKVANQKTEINRQTTEIGNLKSEISNLQSRASAAESAFSNERKGRIDTLLDHAITEGRITAAQRPEWASKLDTNFANEAPALTKLAPALKTRSSTGDLGQRKADLANMQDRQLKVQELVNDRMKTKGESYDSAFANVRREQPALFDAMTQPAKA